jgi:hypothetical protein
MIATVTPAATVAASVRATIDLMIADVVWTTADMFTDADHREDYRNMVRSLAVWVRDDRSVTVSVADTKAGVIHGQGVLTQVLDGGALFDDVFEGGNIVAVSPTTAVLAW